MQTSPSAASTNRLPPKLSVVSNSPICCALFKDQIWTVESKTAAAMSGLSPQAAKCRIAESRIRVHNSSHHEAVAPCDDSGLMRGGEVGVRRFECGAAKCPSVSRPPGASCYLYSLLCLLKTSCRWIGSRPGVRSVAPERATSRSAPVPTKILASTLYATPSSTSSFARPFASVLPDVAAWSPTSPQTITPSAGRPSGHTSTSILWTGDG